MSSDETSVKEMTRLARLQNFSEAFFIIDSSMNLRRIEGAVASRLGIFPIRRTVRKKRTPLERPEGKQL